MRHRWAGRKLGRSSSHRKALMRTMVTEFLEQERMVTTVPKAKELRSVAEKMITLGKRESLHARRQAFSFIRKKSVVFKLFDTIAPRFAERPGGYTRILRLGRRVGDGAELALLELVEAAAAPKEEKPKKGRRGRKKKEPEVKAQSSKEKVPAGESKKSKAKPAKEEPEEKKEG